MTEEQRNEIEVRLLRILTELEGQQGLSGTYLPGALPFADEMRQIREFIEVGREYGAAYETIVATLEAHPFRLSAKAAICLLELGLLFAYKTDRREDKPFDRR